MCGPMTSHNWIRLAINSISIILTSVSLLCVVCNTSLERSLKGLVLSFNIANLVGACLLLYQPMSMLICNNDAADKQTFVTPTTGVGEDDSRFEFFILVTYVLSMSHVIILVLHYYIKLTTSRKHRKYATDYAGLVVISWILSATLGSVNAISESPITKVIISIAFIIMAVCAFWKVYEIHSIKTSIHRIQKQNVQPDSLNVREVEIYWRIKQVAIIFLAHVFCALPWMINELREGFTGVKDTTFEKNALNLYTVNFILPSCIWIQLKYKDRKVNDIITTKEGERGRLIGAQGGELTKL